MGKKMMITGEVIKKPEHIELGKYDIAVRTKGCEKNNSCDMLCGGSVDDKQ
jgi:hypothetical protein